MYVIWLNRPKYSSVMDTRQKDKWTMVKKSLYWLPYADDKETCCLF